MRTIVAVILSTFSSAFLTCAATQDPKIIKSTEFERMVRQFPKDIGFGYSGAAFFQKRLYVSCNLGLLAISEDGKTELLQWRGYDSVIEGPWLDRANGALWAQQAADGSLVRFDGKKWNIMPRLSPPQGSFTRGDVLSGFRGISNAESFWMEGGNFVWKWDSGKTTWKPEPNPPMPGGSHVRAFLPYADELIYFARVGPERDFGVGTGRNSAAIYTFFRGQWHELATADLQVEQYVISDTGAYILTEDGTLFDLTGDKPIRIECPERCEAIGRTSSGGLLASFALHGVFLRVDGSWSLKVKTPYPAGEGEHRAHLAEDNGRIVLATDPVSHLVDSPENADSPDKFEISRTAAIWISDGGDFKRLPIGQ